jgi:hypothetical protein
VHAAFDSLLATLARRPERGHVRARLCIPQACPNRSYATSTFSPPSISGRGVMVAVNTPALWMSGTAPTILPSISPGNVPVSTPRWFVRKG